MFLMIGSSMFEPCARQHRLAVRCTATCGCGTTSSTAQGVNGSFITNLTHLMLHMQGSCGRGVLSISQDCFYKDLTPDQMASISTYNFDHPAAFDFAEILSKLKQLRAGAHFFSSAAFHLSQDPVSVVYAHFWFLCMLQLHVPVLVIRLVHRCGIILLS